jgi:murein DD-endopeptidase MepM/ murein hydrolase activator NlpD
MITIRSIPLILSIIFILPKAWALDSADTVPSEIDISSKILPQGEISLIRVTLKKGQTAVITWQGKEIALIPDPDNNISHGFIAADLEEKPGNYKAYVSVSPPTLEKSIDIEIIEKDYGVRRLTLPEEMVDLDEETLKRVSRESEVIQELWNVPASEPLYVGAFLRPVDGDVVGPFGRRSVINDQPRSPHTGVDLRGQKGEPVKAVNTGKIILTCDHFFSGRSIFLDHGGRITSMYFHLDEILVSEGNTVLKGQTIGYVGSTGRTTGPHLHWGMRINGARVNPLSLITLSKELEE